MDGWDDNTKLLAAAALLAVAVAGVMHALRGIGRAIRRALFPRRVTRPTYLRPVANTRAPAPRLHPTAPFTLKRFWVVDGDTIQDNATKTIYRLENIDCPETDDRARCHRERDLGRRAKFEAVRMLKGATSITVRPTGKIDPYGRAIASIDIDGQDYGQLMIARGFARPWLGVREDWCGPNGGLAKIADACSAKFHCKTCGGRSANTLAVVMNLPAANRPPEQASTTPSPADPSKIS